MKIIQLTQGMIAIVDDEDYERLSRTNWQAVKNKRDWNAQRCVWLRGQGKRRTLLMSRVVMGEPQGLQVDHIHKDDGVIDNRKENLRLVTNQQNTQNMRQKLTSRQGFKGVSKPGRNLQWQARIRANGKNIYLGLFRDEEDAALAYDAAARILFGEFAHTNFPYVFVV